jgi:hypothetical protein
MTGYAPSSTAALGRGTELMLKPFSQTALEVRLHRLFQARDLSD